MKDFVIILSPSKSFDLSKPSNASNPRPKYLSTAKDIFHIIKKLSLEETKDIYKLSDKKAQEVFNMHQQHGEKLYYAIEMYSGLVFKQLKLEEYDREWLNEHVVILDALYGIIKPYDLIAPYRLDFKTNIGINLINIWQDKINEQLKDKRIINIASKEFSSLVKQKMEEIELVPEKQIKISRGKTAHNFLKKSYQK